MPAASSSPRVSSPVLEQALQRHGVWRGRALAADPETLPTGYPELDAELPGGGWPTGALTELLVGHRGIGEMQLVLRVVAALTASGRRVMWISPPHLPYPPALAAAGVDLAHFTAVQAPGRRDALWAAEQALRTHSCHALLAWFERPRYEELRRLAVAAEGGRAFMLLFRPPEAAAEPSPACLRIALEPEGASLAVRILKRRGAPARPMRLPVSRPAHVLDRPSFPLAAAESPAAPRRVGLPVHA